MTDRDYKRRLKRELSGALPAMSNELRRELELRCPRAGSEVRLPPPRLTRRGLSAVCLAAILLICTALVSTLNYLPDSRFSGILLEINPCIALSADGRQRVTAVVSRNREGDVLLSDAAFADSLTGMTVTGAITALTDRAVRLGFVLADERENAVKVSVTGDTAGRLEGALKSSLENYFRQDGIYAAVLSQKVTLSEFRAKLGLKPEGTFKETAKDMRQLPLSGMAFAYAEQEADLSELYRSYLVPYLREQLGRYCGEIAAKRDRILAIYELNQQIEAHEDNPNLLFRDYWSLSEEPQDYTAAFAALMEAMDALVAEYGRLYADPSNISMDCKANLVLLKNLFSVLDDETLAALQQDAADLLHSDAIEVFIRCLDTINRAAAQLLELAVEIPRTAAECIARTADLLAAEADSRADVYLPLYQAERPVITQTAYGEYLDWLEQTFGSLERFWESKGDGAAVSPEEYRR